MVELKGDSSLLKSKVSLNAMIRMVEREKSILVELASLLELTPSNGNEPDFIIQDLLTQFLDVFQKPYGLLSMRSRDHSIILQGGAAPVNV